MTKKLFYAIYGLNLAIILYFWAQTSLGLFALGPGNALVSFARISALLGSFSVLVQFVLISRASWLERIFGFDKLTRIHRLNGLVALALITAHVFLIILGYALRSGTGYWAQFAVFLQAFPYVPLAAAAYLILLATVGFSLVIVRRRLKYETWYLVHLLNYTVVLLAFWHQIFNGLELLVNDIFRYYWIGLYIAALTHLLYYRFTKLALRFIRHRFYVESIEPETPGSRSIYIKGRNIERFRYRAGQFAKWRFLHRDFFTEEHPFTISVEPNGEYLRLTPKSIGDYTARMDAIPIGTKVLLSGPLGTFTAQRTDNSKLLFIAGGIGITPLRAIIGELQNSRRDMVLLYAAQTADDLALRAELEEVAKTAKLKITYVLSEEERAGYAHGYVDTRLLEAAVPDAAERDVFLCGPPPMMRAVRKSLHEVGVDDSAIHTEQFTLL